MAKPNYAVGGLIANANKGGLNAMKVIFMKLKNGKLDKTDSYTTDWICKPDNWPVEKLSCNGDLVIGTWGRQGLNLDAVGLVVIPSEPQAAPESDPTSKI